MIEYKYKKKENKFTENGHAMFKEDVLQRLKRLAYLEEQIKQGQKLPIDSVSKRLEMRKQASNVFELTKGFTTEPTDNAMKTALEMAHNVMVLTTDLDG